MEWPRPVNCNYLILLDNFLMHAADCAVFADLPVIDRMSHKRLHWYSSVCNDTRSFDLHYAIIAL